jgi:hypothetical protein
MVCGSRNEGWEDCQGEINWGRIYSGLFLLYNIWSSYCNMQFIIQ